MLGMTRLPKPKLMDTYVRANHDGAYEEASIVNITTWPGGSWKAILLSEAGWDHVTDALEFRSANEWRPGNWELEKAINAWHPPGVRWDDEECTWTDIGASKKAEAQGGLRPGVRPPAPAAG